MYCILRYNIVWIIMHSTLLPIKIWYTLLKTTLLYNVWGCPQKVWFDPQLVWIGLNIVWYKTKKQKTWYSCHKNPKLTHLSPKINATAFLLQNSKFCVKRLLPKLWHPVLYSTLPLALHTSEVTSSQQREIIFWLSLEGRSEGWEATLGSVGSISWIISRKKIR